MLSPTFLNLYGLWYSKRPARTHDERVFNGLKNFSLLPEKIEKYWRKIARKNKEKCKYLGLQWKVFQTVKNSFIVSRFEYHKPYKFKKICENFFQIFSEWGDSLSRSHKFPHSLTHSGFCSRPLQTYRLLQNLSKML